MQTNKKQTCSLLVITNEIDVCNEFVFRHKNDFDEFILVITNGEKIMPLSRQCQIHYYDWDNNFSNALNFGISKCTSDWIFRLDSDEMISPVEVQRLHQLIQTDDYDYFLCNVFTFSEDFRKMPPGQQAKYRDGFLPRLWRGNMGVIYENYVHELNVMSIQRNHLRGGINTVFGICHMGEIGLAYRDVAFTGKRSCRNELIFKQLELTPSDARFNSYAGIIRLHEGRFDEALAYAQKACEYCIPNELLHYLKKKEEVLNIIKKSKDNFIVDLMQPSNNQPASIP